MFLGFHVRSIAESSIPEHDMDKSQIWSRWVIYLLFAVSLEGRFAFRKGWDFFLHAAET
jgi:hypothetical protein